MPNKRKGCRVPPIPACEVRSALHVGTLGCHECAISLMRFEEHLQEHDRLEINTERPSAPDSVSFEDLAQDDSDPG